jgi:hypothetical protein
MAKRARVVLVLTYHEDTKALDVFMGDENPECGCAKKVVERNGITLAVTGDNEPVFIRIPNAQSLNKTFKAIAKRAEAEKPANGLQIRHAVKFCLKCTDSMLHAGKRRAMPKVAKFIFNSMSETA